MGAHARRIWSELLDCGDAVSPGYRFSSSTHCAQAPFVEGYGQQRDCQKIFVMNKKPLQAFGGMRIDECLVCDRIIRVLTPLPFQ